MKIIRENRTLHISEIPQLDGFKDLPTSLSIHLNYDYDRKQNPCGVGSLGIVLDNVIIPKIVSSLQDFDSYKHESE